MCFPLTAALGLDQACFRRLLVTSSLTQGLSIALYSSGDLASAQRCFSEPVLRLLQYLSRPRPETLPWPSAAAHSLPVFLPRHQSVCLSVCLSVCRQGNLAAGNSDHHTTQLQIPRNLSKLLITARSSFQGCLLPPLTRVLLARPHPQPLTPPALYSATSRACLTPSPGAGAFPLLHLLLSFSRWALLVLYKRCRSSVHPRRSS